ncbi:MAG: auxin-binding protein, partial [Hyphomicrobiales bacterium]
MNLKKLWPLPVAAIALVAGSLALASTQAPADLDYSLSHASERGLYAVTVAPAVDPIPVGQLHAWTVAVRTPDGSPVAADVVFDGGMPQHGHG